MGGAPAMWTWSAFRPFPGRMAAVPGQPRELRRKAARHSSPRPVVTAPRFFPASSVPSGELDGPDVTTVTPLSTAGRGQRLEEGNKQESEKAEAIYQAVGEGPEEVGRRTAGCPAH